jgi:transcription initiation factor TFIIH subunit 4
VGSDASAIIGQSIAASRALEESLAAPVPSRSHLAIVVQTNFQVVCYTRSKLHISTLGLFCDVTTFRKLPNVIFFHITRDSIRSAFRLGVLADQILRFLHVHAHPMLRNGDQPSVPSNVTDQILLWDKERHRVVMDEVSSQCVNICQ